MNRRVIEVVCVLVFIILGSLGTLNASFNFKGSDTTTRISVASDGSEGNNSSTNPSISADGRYVAFTSNASNLVAEDTNGEADTFVYDGTNETTIRVSVASNGTQGNNGSESWDTPSISADGRYVAFSSSSTNLVPGQTNAYTDIFVKDRETNSTMLVSVTSSGSQGNMDSSHPSISADGRFVAFKSYATNLVPNDTNGEADIFVHDRNTGITMRVSVASDGTEGDGESGYDSSPSISADGRYIAFMSFATNLVIGDTNDEGDIFVHDLESGITRRVSVASDGTQGNRFSDTPSISSNGRYVTFMSLSTNLVTGDYDFRDIFVHDRDTSTTMRVSVASDGRPGEGDSDNPSISADGLYVAFRSQAMNLVDGDSNGWDDIFVHNRISGTTRRVSVASNGLQGNGGTFRSSISTDGLYVAYMSDATNLVSSDTNVSTDIFVHDRDAIPEPTPTATLPPVSEVVTYCSDYNFIPIPDGDPTGITGTLLITQNATIQDVNIVISATHPWVGDLNFTLRDGTRMANVINRPGVPDSKYGCGSDNYHYVTIDDEGSWGNIEEICPVTSNRYIGGDPANPDLLSVYDGFSTSGTWLLHVIDAVEPYSGTLDQFCLEFTIPIERALYLPLVRRQ